MPNKNQRILDSPVLQQRVLELLRAGASRASVCQEIGISPNTWRAYNRANPDFAEAVVAAEEVAVDTLMRDIYQDALAGDQKSRELWLKYKVKDMPAQTVNVNVNNDQPAPDAVVSTILERLEARALEQGEDQDGVDD